MQFTVVSPFVVLRENQVVHYNLVGQVVDLYDPAEVEALLAEAKVLPAGSGDVGLVAVPPGEEAPAEVEAPADEPVAEPDPAEEPDGKPARRGRGKDSSES